MTSKASSKLSVVACAARTRESDEVGPLVGGLGAGLIGSALVGGTGLAPVGWPAVGGLTPGPPGAPPGGAPGGARTVPPSVGGGGRGAAATRTAVAARPLKLR